MRTPPGFDPFDRVGHELGMGPLDRRVEVRRHDEALARGAVVGAQPLAQFGIGDALLEVGDAHVLDHFDLRRVRIDHRLGEQTEELREVRVHLLELARVASVRVLLLVGVRRILLRHDPLRGSLEQRQVRDPIHDRGRDLHGRGAGTDDADARAVDRCVVVPAGAVEHGAGEGVAALDVRIARLMQHAGRRDHDVHFVVRAAFGLELPAPGGEAATDDALAVARVPVEAVIACDAGEVRADLRTGREPVAPFGIRRERVAVEVRRDVAREARIRVLAPGTAGPVAFLVDGEVGDPGFQQLHAAEDPGHARPDDRDAEVARCSSRFRCAHRART